MKKREEIEEKYKWDLSYLYESDEDWYKDFPLAIEKTEKFKDFLNITYDNSDNLFEYLKYRDEAISFICKLWLYAISKFDVERINDKYREMYKKIDDVYSEARVNSNLVIKLICKMDFEKIKDIIVKDDRLKEYEVFLYKEFRFKKHQLSDEQKEIINSLGDSFIHQEASENLRNNDMKIGTIKDEKGEEVELTYDNYFTYSQSNDRRVRKNAFNKIFSAYGNNKNCLTTLFSGFVATQNALATMCNYNSALEASLYDEDIDLSVYNNLIDTVSKNIKVVEKYWELKKELLELQELHLYDIYATPITKPNNKYPYEKGLNLVLKAVEPLGEEYIEMLEDYISRKHIDVYGNLGKTLGSYRRYILGQDPLVLLNYDDSIVSVNYLAHELGHAIHTCYSNLSNPYINTGCTSFVGEVPSTVNEFLLWDYIMKNTENLEEKLYIQDFILGEFQKTIIRQTMFAEFEKMIYEKQANGEILTSELLCNCYYDLNKKYFGENIIIDDVIRYEWMKVPHFYWNFYCYTYATGLASACQISTSILEQGQNYVEKYIDFLRTGKSDTPTNELLMAGIDIKNSSYIENAMKKFDKTIDEMRETYRQYKKIKK